MKEKIAIITARIVVCLLVVSSLFLNGCGAKNKDTSDGNSLPNLGEKEIEKNEDDEVSVDEDPADESSKADEAEYAKQKYQDFIDGNEPLYFDIISGYTGNNSYNFYEIEDYIHPKKPYLFEEFIHAYCDAEYEYWGSKIKPVDIDYAYIDCGNDGIPELALKFNGVETDNLIFDAYWVIKCTDDKLQALMYKSIGYRSWGELNEYGLYTSGGAFGAGAYVNDFEYIDANGTLSFVYGCETDLTAYSVYIPDKDNHSNVAAELGIAENINVYLYYFTLDYDDTRDYSKYLREDCLWTYEAVSDNGNVYSDKTKYNAKAYEDYWDYTELPFYTQDEIDAILEERKAEFGIDDQILNGEEPDWVKLSDTKIDDLYSWWEEPEALSYVLDMPPWEYVNNSGYITSTAVRLTEISATANDITDDYLWFDYIGWEQPNRFMFSDNFYTYELSGLSSEGYVWYPYLMDIYEKDSDNLLYSLDFSYYYTPDSYNVSDAAFVDEAIKWAVSQDDVLYVCTSHNTYASSAPHNAYITALDMKDDFAVIWRSEPLTCNSNNFVIYADAIICGYGFTNEDDYIYILDLYTGERKNTIKVKTGPDWFYINNNTLYVRTYNTDYEYLIEMDY